MGRLNAAAQAKIVRELEQAKALGHDVDNLIQVRQTKTQMGWASVCSCGWTSNSRKRKVAVLSLAYLHVLDVVHGEIPPFDLRPDGVSLPETVRPVCDAL